MNLIDGGVSSYYIVFAHHPSAGRGNSAKRSQFGQAKKSCETRHQEQSVARLPRYRCQSTGIQVCGLIYSMHCLLLYIAYQNTYPLCGIRKITPRFIYFGQRW
jgi:hypothetical protein